MKKSRIQFVLMAFFCVFASAGSALASAGSSGISMEIASHPLVLNDPPSKPVITFPANQSVIQIAGDPSLPFNVTWNASTDSDGDALTYTWEVWFILAVIYEQEVGDATQIDLDIGTIHELLVQNNFGPGSTLSLSHRVRVSDGTTTVYSDFALVTVEVGELNYPPSPVTSLNPSANTNVELTGEPLLTGVTVSWSVPDDPDGDALAYSWDLSDNGSFDPVRISRSSLSDSSLTLTTGELNDLLRDQLQVPAGGSATLYHRVTVSDGITSPVVGSTAQFQVTRGAVTSVQDAELPQSLMLLDNYPNPFSSFTTVRFSNPVAEYARIRLFNVSGQEVASLFDGFVEAGWHSVRVDASSLPAGVYFYRLETGNGQVTSKMTILSDRD